MGSDSVLVLMLGLREELDGVVIAVEDVSDALDIPEHLMFVTLSLRFFTKSFTSDDEVSCLVLVRVSMILSTLVRS